MELIDTIYNDLIKQVAQSIDIIYLFTFMLLSYLIKNKFEDSLNRITKAKWRTVYTVLIIATLTAIPFVFYSDTSVKTILFTYTLGTSLHELFFKLIETKLFKK